MQLVRWKAFCLLCKTIPYLLFVTIGICVLRFGALCRKDILIALLVYSHIKAHQVESSDNDDTTNWAIRMNNWVDTVAKDAVRTFWDDN